MPGRFERSMAIVMLLTVATAGCGSSASLPVFNPFDTVDAGDCGSGCVDAGADRGQGGRDPGQGTDPGEHPTDSLDPDVAVAPVDPGADTVFQDPGTGDPGASDLGLACTSTPNCDLGQLCINSHCIPGCQSERDCPDGMRCDAADGPPLRLHLHFGCRLPFQCRPAALLDGGRRVRRVPPGLGLPDRQRVRIDPVRARLPGRP